jgi:hypothetical protein
MYVGIWPLNLESLHQTSVTSAVEHLGNPSLYDPTQTTPHSAVLH